MKITSFPALNTYIAFKVLVEWLGHDFVEPEKLNSDMLKWGSRYISEYACLPCKGYGGFYESCRQKGIDAVIMFGTRDVRACRYNEIGDGYLHEAKKQNKGFGIIYWGGFGKKSAISSLQSLSDSGRSPRKITFVKLAYASILFANILDLVDYIEQEANRLRPREKKRGEIDKWLGWSLDRAKKEIKNIKDIKKLRKEIEIKKRQISIDLNKKIPRVIFVGDLFKIHEDFYHFDSFRKCSETGIELVRTINFSDIFRAINKIPPLAKEKTTKYRTKLSKKYLHAVPASYLDWTAGDLVNECNNEKVDGIIHFQTFNCMPDIILKSVVDRIARDYKKPIIHFMRDEHSSDTGYMTRLEAFSDLIKSNSIQ